MTEDEAKELLLLHSFRHPDSAQDPRAANGFLGSLRPFKGRLNVANYHEVMKALRTVAPRLTRPEVDRELVAAIWGICHLGAAWGVRPDGMLRSNDLISPAESQRLAEWVSSVSQAMWCLLDGADASVAFEGYDEHES